MEQDRPPTVGSRFTTTRIGGAEQTSTQEITQITPPTSWAARGINGPVRVLVSGTVEPLDDGTRSRVTIALDFEEPRSRQGAGAPRRPPAGSQASARKLPEAERTARDQQLARPQPEPLWGGPRRCCPSSGPYPAQSKHRQRPFWACLWIEPQHSASADLVLLRVRHADRTTTVRSSFSVPPERRPFKPCYASVSPRLAVQRK